MVWILNKKTKNQIEKLGVFLLKFEWTKPGIFVSLPFGG